LIQLCLEDKILNFDKINIILDRYLAYRKEEIDRKRKSGNGKAEAQVEIAGKEGSVITFITNHLDKRKLAQTDDVMLQTIYKFASGGVDVVNGKKIHMINRRYKDQTLEVEEYLHNLDSENFLEKLTKAWYTALFFTINDFIIALLPVIQLEYYKVEKLPPNCYIICEFLNVVALMDPIINYKSNKQLFYRKLIMFKLYTTLTLIVLSNILQFANIPISSTEVKVACHHPGKQEHLLRLVYREPLEDHIYP
jgi:hypothetical protein